jgi:hypothetical protein
MVVPLNFVFLMLPSVTDSVVSQPARSAGMNAASMLDPSWRGSRLCVASGNCVVALSLFAQNRSFCRNERNLVLRKDFGRAEEVPGSARRAVGFVVCVVKLDSLPLDVRAGVGPVASFDQGREHEDELRNQGQQ